MSKDKKQPETDISSEPSPNTGARKTIDKPVQKEVNGPKGLEPTRYGDWESKGRCYDF